MRHGRIIKEAKAAALTVPEVVTYMVGGGRERPDENLGH
jgi:hypothetical protein